MRRTVLASLSAALLAAATLLVPAAAPAAPPPVDDHLAAAAPTPALHWTGCGGEFQCTTAAVPLDYHAPRGRQVNLALIRRPAGDPAHRIGSLFVNFGGPGSEGLDHLRGRAHWDWLFSPRVLARFDLVSWDPRGIGHSDPVNCFGSATERDTFLDALPPFPVGAAQQASFYRGYDDLARRCRAHAGDLLDHVSTANTARDLDLLRRAVGDAKLTYHGISYGTQLAATYANLFPDRVRALVLDGSLDFQGNSTGHGTAGFTTPLDVRQGIPEALADTFDDFLAQCAAPGAHCAFAGGDLHAKFARLAATARRAPIQGYTYADVIGLLNDDLAIPDRWQELAAALQALSTGHHPAPPALARAAAPYTDNTTEAFNAIQCADSIVPRGGLPYTVAAAIAERRVPYFGDVGVYDMMGCAFWRGHDADRYLGPWNRSTAPVMVVNSRHDPSTPLPGARDGIGELRNAHLLVVNGSGHSTMLVRSHCAAAATGAYLVDGVLPKPGATCGIDDTPFDDVAPPPD